MKTRQVSCAKFNEDDTSNLDERSYVNVNFCAGTAPAQVETCGLPLCDPCNPIFFQTLMKFENFGGTFR